MFGLLVVIAAGVTMFHVAEAEDRSGLLWAVGTIAAGLGLAFYGFGGLIGGGVALIVAFSLMFVLNFSK